MLCISLQALQYIQPKLTETKPGTHHKQKDINEIQYGTWGAEIQVSYWFRVTGTKSYSRKITKEAVLKLSNVTVKKVTSTSGVNNLCILAKRFAFPLNKIALHWLRPTFSSAKPQPAPYWHSSNVSTDSCHSACRCLHPQYASPTPWSHTIKSFNKRVYTVRLATMTLVSTCFCLDVWHTRHFELRVAM